MKNILYKLLHKKSYVNMVLGVFCASLMLGSCESDLDDKFYDPDKLTTVSFEMLFTGVLQETELFRLEYGPGYHYSRAFNRFLGLGLFPYEALNNAEDGQNKPWAGWSGVNLRESMYKKTYINFNKNIPAMNLILNGLSDDEKQKMGIYVDCVNVVRAYAFQRLTDACDDIPYSEAGGAFENKFYAKYDSQQEIYHSILDMLKEVGEKLSTYEITDPVVAEKFAAADILNNGDVLLWAKFANSLRLRMAMRLSIVEPQLSEQIIGEIISQNLPLVSEAGDFIGMAEKNFAQVMEIYWPRAFKEMYYNFHAPNFMMKNIFGYNGPATPVDQVDPRYKVIFQPNLYGDYIGIDINGPTQFPMIDADMGALNYGADTIKKAKDWQYDDHTEPHFSMYNKLTFNNYKMEYPAFTASETHLLLAEAAIRFPGATGSIDPEEEYKKAISESIDWHYTVNNTNTFGETTFPAIPSKLFEGAKAEKPAEADITAFLTNKGVAFDAMNNDDKIKEIFYQKFAHLNILNYFEIWSEARRLKKDYGELVPRNKPYAFMERFEYPVGEPQSNPDNYQTVAAKDNPIVPVWWTGRSE